MKATILTIISISLLAFGAVLAYIWLQQKPARDEAARTYNVQKIDLPDES